MKEHAWFLINHNLIYIAEICANFQKLQINQTEPKSRKTKRLPLTDHQHPLQLEESVLVGGPQYLQ
jgi:hypothetical protein